MSTDDWEPFVSLVENEQVVFTRQGAWNNVNPTNGKMSRGSISGLVLLTNFRIIGIVDAYNGSRRVGFEILLDSVDWLSTSEQQHRIYTHIIIKQLVKPFMRVDLAIQFPTNEDSITFYRELSTALLTWKTKKIVQVE